MIPLAAAVVLAALMAITYLVGRRLGRHNVVDVAWGIGFTLVAVASAVLGNGDTARRWLMAGLVTVWGLRLAGYLAWRSRGKGEDARYEKMLASAGGRREWAVISRIYLVQPALIWLISLPVQVNATEGPLNAIAAVGVLVWGVGLAFEAIGDAQLARFKADVNNRGRVMDRGLWRYTRHPNYFGDACVWWGLYLVAASAWPGPLTVVSPIVMTVLLTKVSGRDLLEKHLADRPGYRHYLQRTSGFLPRPPRDAHAE